MKPSEYLKIEKFIFRVREFLEDYKKLCLKYKLFINSCDDFGEYIDTIPEDEEEIIEFIWNDFMSDKKYIHLFEKYKEKELIK